MEANLALAILVKDETELLRNILSSYSQYFDEVCVLSTSPDKRVKREINKIVLSHNAKVFEYKWRKDFAHARNYLADKIQSPYYFRLDVDDEIDHPERIRDSFNRYVERKFTLIYCKYLYGFDRNGNCNALHWRETIIKRDGNLYWNKPIHENILPKSTNLLVAGKDTAFQIIHHHSDKRTDESFERNLQALLKEYEETKDDPDPRTTRYLGWVYLAKKEYEKSIKFFHHFLKTSGWPDDKYFGWIRISECYRGLNQLEKALSCCFEALTIRTDWPDVYFALMNCYYEKGDWQKAIDWGKIGLEKPTPDTMLVIDPSSYTWRPFMTMGMCYMNLGMFAQSKELIKKALELAPKEKSIQENLNFVEELNLDNEAAKRYLWLMMYAKEKDRVKLPELIKSIPRQLTKDERLIRMRHQLEPPKKWSDNSIVFYCGASWEDWADPSVIKGIGGSEEAVIYLSREFVKLGYEVTVFNQCGEWEGKYQGVEYKNFYEFNPNDDYNIVVSWRQNFLGGIKAEKKFIWMHDVPMPDWFKNPEELKTFDKIIVLSQFHRSLLVNVPDEKLLISSNGINEEDFKGSVEARNPRRIIYTSSYDRGLEHLLAMWPLIREKIPDAELHIFYGWDTYDKMVKAGRRDPKFKEEMVKGMQQEGIYEHGRIGHKKLIREFYKSGVWAYPSHFEEISCISAMKAQVCGAIPIVTDYCALSETVKWGIKIAGLGGTNNEIFANRLISLLKSPEIQEAKRQEMKPALEEFSWSKVAKQWEREFPSKVAIAVETPS